jgi:hypothetical protein
MSEEVRVGQVLTYAAASSPRQERLRRIQDVEWGRPGFPPGYDYSNDAEILRRRYTQGNNCSSCKEDVAVSVDSHPRLNAFSTKVTTE